MTNEMMLRDIEKFEKLDPKLQKAIIDRVHKLVEENRSLKEQAKECDKKYIDIIHGLSNRCFMFTNGTLCLFCNIDCKFRKIDFNDDTIDPFKLMELKPDEIDDALAKGSLKKDK